MLCKGQIASAGDLALSWGSVKDAGVWHCHEIILPAWSGGGLTHRLLKHGGHSLQFWRAVVDFILPVLRFSATWIFSSFHKRSEVYFFCSFTWSSYVVCFSQWNVGGHDMIERWRGTVHLVLFFAITVRRWPCYLLSLRRQRRCEIVISA